MNVLIADSGATKCQWTYLSNNKAKHVFTIGISPYFLKQEEIETIVKNEVLKKLKQPVIDKVFFLWNRIKQPY